MGLGQYRNVFKRSTGRALTAALMLTTAIGVGMMVTDHSAFAQSEAQTSFSVPAGPLNQALTIFGRQAGVQVTYLASIAAGKTTSGVSGNVSRDQALATILAGSGLVYSFPNATTVAISQPSDVVAGTSSAGDETVLDPIIVQGEKFARDIFNTFTSVQVVTSDELDDYVRQSLDEALNSSPNIRMFESSGNSDINIRGLNAEGPVPGGGSDPVISVSIDGAEQPITATRRGSRGTWDVEQIEVLRGPQSTLQGGEALGGAVVIKTKDPTFTPEAIFRQEIDSDGLYSGAFAVSGPIIEDQLAFRLSGQVTRDDKGISYSDPQWAAYGDEEFEEFRGKLLFTPSELPGFSALLTASRTHDKPAYNLVSGPNFFDRNYVTGGFEEFRDTIVNRYVADLKYEFNPDWTVQSVTSFVATKFTADAPPSATYFREETADRGTFSQDIRLTYGSEESAFSGVLGLYAGHSSGHGVSDLHYDVFGYGYTIPLQQIESRSKNTSLAVYADGRYEFMDRWTLLAGGRLLHDKASYNVEGTILPGTFLEASLDRDDSMSTTAFLPKIGLAFELSENQNIALTASKGYRRGFSEMITGTTTINIVEPESMWAYELAYRSKWLDDRLQINGNVFYYDYTNMQVPVPVPGLYGAVYTYTMNAGQSHSYGAELEARWNFDSGLEVFGSLGLLKTRFDEAEYNGGSIAGNEFPNAPALTASLGAMYKHHSGWFVGGDVSFTDGYYSKGGVRNLPTTAVDSFTIVNAQLGYETENLKFTAYAKNLLDEKYLTSISSTGATANVGDRRAFGLQLTQKF